MAIAHPRPAEPTVSVHREPVEGDCPQCTSAQLQADPVLTEGGWFDVVRCANCLHDVSREPGPLLGPSNPWST